MYYYSASLAISPPHLLVHVLVGLAMASNKKCSLRSQRLINWPSSCPDSFLSQTSKTTPLLSLQSNCCQRCSKMHSRCRPWLMYVYYFSGLCELPPPQDTPLCLSPLLAQVRHWEIAILQWSRKTASRSHIQSLLPNRRGQGGQVQHNPKPMSRPVWAAAWTWPT